MDALEAECDASFDDDEDQDAGFTDWLLKQRLREDPVGDLARDFELDDSHADARELERILRGPAYEAFERALDEFRAERCQTWLT